MSISVETNKVQYRGTGAQTAFPIPFYFLDNAHILVVLYDVDADTEVTKTITTHYTITGAGEQAGGTLTMLTAPAAHELLTILRDVPITQLVDWRENELFQAGKTEGALDKITMILQQLDELMRRGIILKTTYSGAAVDFPAGGFTTVFPARITAAVSLTLRTFTFEEVEPVAATGSWTTKSGGITGTASELVVGDSSSWTDDIPLYTNIFVHENEDGDETYCFQTPYPLN